MTCACVICVVSASSTVEVETKLGIIRGLNITRNNQIVLQFLQVPYAQPPIYALRFHKPKKFLSWIGVLNATKFGPVCPQILSNRYKKILENPNISENCLHLYIYIPNGIDQRHPKPVMVYIHGGGYYSKSATFYDGSDLALKGDVIVVLINYRLGMFGFMSTEDNTSKGNYGLWDQILALNWIKEHISSFGGDQTKVTVFGHSAGGYSIGILSLSPLTEGLYQRAVSMSGFGTSERAITHGAKNTTVRLAKLLSCIDESMETESVDTSSIVHCIRTKPMSAILKATASIKADHTKALSFIMSPGPVVDNEIILDIPKRLLTDPSSASFKLPSIIWREQTTLMADY
ncbi:LOW QUALITY PROTEIN: hypothetical protein KUTeg_005405 [Tegillarca granosa]|uniref:Carboxylic ester hydrolase n=1 Tax=Tegillarca granosa TaxID=220873 RepID=A0ABQ9FMW1_TEGGR|nr:LOW QUALITY PROTEIN: hypothetical protein KUTeg_005405 [Tegillarca granosa]